MTPSTTKIASGTPMPAWWPRFPGVFVGADGSPIASPLSRRAICPTGPQLQAIPNVLAVAYGVEKADGVRSVLKGSLVNGLVTHTAMAEALLARD